MSSTSSLPPYRVFAFGDSLTAGTSGYGLHPYAPYLETAINANDELNGRQVIVQNLGLPGWTAKKMLNNLDGGRAGLRTAIRNIQNPPLSLVIILVGTNDMGNKFNEHEITENILKLHQVCYDEGVPRTIAIGIPPSGYQSQDAGAARLAKSVNSNIEKFCRENPERATFHPFPFPFELDGENWDEDTLHFSQIGYQTLGESLVNVVMELLNAT
jgi:lysophospholipase L1-like esterase